MIDGATNPPMTPNALIAAIPAADAAPDKKAAGIDQKGGVKASVAANAIVTATIRLVGSTSNAAAKAPLRPEDWRRPRGRSAPAPVGSPAPPDHSD